MGGGLPEPVGLRGAEDREVMRRIKVIPGNETEEVPTVDDFAASRRQSAELRADRIRTLEAELYRVQVWVNDMAAEVARLTGRLEMATQLLRDAQWNAVKSEVPGSWWSAVRAFVGGDDG